MRLSSRRLKWRVWNVLEVSRGPDGGKAKLGWINRFLMILIVLSTIAVIFETVEDFRERYSAALVVFEVFTVVVFSVEYVVRLWACTAVKRYRRPIRGRLRYAVTFYAVVDLLAVLPFWVAIALPMSALDLRFLRVMRLMRFARLLKIGRYSDAFDRLRAVFRSKLPDLGVVLVAIAVALVLASSFMYHAENGAQPNKFSSIPASMWWAVSALTTVGYGDIQPVTPLGKALGGIIQILAISLFALPAGILAAGYEEQARRRRAGMGACPHCGWSGNGGPPHGDGPEEQVRAIEPTLRADSEEVRDAL